MSPLKFNWLTRLFFPGAYLATEKLVCCFCNKTVTWCPGHTSLRNYISSHNRLASDSNQWRLSSTVEPSSNSPILASSVYFLMGLSVFIRFAATQLCWQTLVLRVRMALQHLLQNANSIHLQVHWAHGKTSFPSREFTRLFRRGSEIISTIFNTCHSHHFNLDVKDLLDNLNNNRKGQLVTKRISSFKFLRPEFECIRSEINDNQLHYVELHIQNAVKIETGSFFFLSSLTCLKCTFPWQ